MHIWISKYSRPLENTKAVRTDDHLYEELKRLKKEVAQLSEERHLLKKPAAYFAKEQRWSTRGSNNTVTNLESAQCAGLCRFPEALTMIGGIAPRQPVNRRMLNRQASSKKKSPGVGYPWLPGASTNRDKVKFTGQSPTHRPANVQCRFGR